MINNKPRIKRTTQGSHKAEITSDFSTAADRFLSQKHMSFLCLLGIIIMFCAIILSVQGYREKNESGVFPGWVSYHNLYAAESMNRTGDKWQIRDDLVYSGNSEIITPAHIIAKKLDFDVDRIRYLSLALGILAILLFYMLANRILQRPFELLLACLVLVLSPAFISAYVSFSIYSFAIVLILLGILLLESRKNYFIIALLILATVPFFGITALIAELFLISMFAIFRKDDSKRYWGILLVCAVIGFILSRFVPYTNISQLPDFINKIPLQGFLSDLGGLYGLSLFAVFAGVIGFFRMCTDQKHHVTLYLLFLLAFAYSLFVNSQINIFLSFILAILAANGIIWLFSAKWQLPLLKTMSIGLVLYGILFSGIAYARVISTDAPGAHLIDALRYMKQNESFGLVLSSYDNSEYITYYAERPVLLSETSINAKDLKKEIDSFYQLRNIQKIADFCTKYNVTYLLITPEMKDGGVWESPNQGMLFVLQKSNIFIKIYDKDGVEIWKFAGETEIQ